MANVAVSGHTPAAVQVTSARPIDSAHLARYTLGDASLEREILGLFIAQAPQTLARLREADSERSWREAAHTLKGSARAVGAWRLAKAAEDCEQGPGWHSRSTAAGMIAEVEAALEEVRTWIAAVSQVKTA